MKFQAFFWHMNSVAAQQHEGAHFHPQVLMEHVGFTQPAGLGRFPEVSRGVSPFLNHSQDTQEHNGGRSVCFILPKPGLRETPVPSPQGRTTPHCSTKQLVPDSSCVLGNDCSTSLHGRIPASAWKMPTQCSVVAVWRGGHVL